MEMILCERNRFGKKTGKMLTFRTTELAWLADRCEREALKGVRKHNREKARDKFYGGDARP